MRVLVNRAGLSHNVRMALKRLPPPFANHYGVVPSPPPSAHPSVIPVARECEAANAALTRLETIASELGDPWLISRIVMRQEALSSSAIEGTNSTLDELLLIEETGDTRGQYAADQVKDYALCLDTAVPRAMEIGPNILIYAPRVCFRPQADARLVCR